MEEGRGGHGEKGRERGQDVFKGYSLSLDVLLETVLVNTIDAPSLALIVPVSVGGKRAGKRCERVGYAKGTPLIVPVGVWGEA